MGHRSSSVSWQFDTSSVYPGLIECFGCLLQHTLIRGWPTTGWSDLGACHMVVSRGPFAVHTVFHVNQSQWMLLSVLVASSFIFFLRACPLIPNSFRSLMVELATKPLHSTSNRSTLTSHPLSSASANKLAYRSLFFSFTSSVPSFQEFVSSTMKAGAGRKDLGTIGKYYKYISTVLRAKMALSRFLFLEGESLILKLNCTPHTTKGVTWT